MWDFLSETSIIYKVKCIMINKDSDIEIIISRYLSKESTAEDIKILDDWISATPENYKSFLAQKNIWEISHPAFNLRKR